MDNGTLFSFTTAKNVSMKSILDNYVIDAVRKERMAQKISQAMLSIGIGVSHSFVGQVENPNHRAKYNLNHLNEIAKYLGCSPRDFLPEKPL